jgi:DNA-binding CsgD family transcriptional regulator
MNLQQIIAKKIRDLYQDGEAAKDLADQYKISISLVYSIIRNESNFDPTYKYKRRLKADPEKIWSLYKQGLTYAQISKELSTTEEFISPSLVGHHVRRIWERENLK